MHRCECHVESADLSTRTFHRCTPELNPRVARTALHFFRPLLVTVRLDLLNRRFGPHPSASSINGTSGGVDTVSVAKTFVSPPRRPPAKFASSSVADFLFANVSYGCCPRLPIGSHRESPPPMVCAVVNKSLSRRWRLLPGAARADGAHSAWFCLLFSSVFTVVPPPPSPSWLLAKPAKELEAQPTASSPSGSAFASLAAIAPPTVVAKGKHDRSSLKVPALSDGGALGEEEGIARCSKRNM